MSTSPHTSQPNLSDYTRPLLPLVGSLLLVALGTGFIFRLRGLGFIHGIIGFLVSAGLTLGLIGGLAFAGASLDRRLGHDVTFRLLGAAIGFAVLMLVLYRLAPVFLTPEVAEAMDLR